MHERSGNERKELARKALKQYERWRELVSITSDFTSLTRLAQVAVEAGDYSKAEKYARELLQLSARATGRPWGNAIHHGNIASGRVALTKGKVDSAKRYLLAAAETPGSPQLDSFGPSVLLANELLEIGEREAVIEYFERVGRFWRFHRGRLHRWIEDARAGRPLDITGRVT